MINEQNIGIKFSNSVTGQKKLEKYEQTLSSIQTLLKNMPNTMKFGDGDKQLNSMSKSLTNVEKSIKTIADKMNKFNSETKETKNNLENAFSVGSIIILAKQMAQVYNYLQKNIKASATYLENMNLLDVAYNNNTQSADKLVNRLTQMYGLDESWGYRTVGMFKQLSNAMGLADETGTKLSNTLTMLSIDLASLYNTDTQNAVQKLASALAGQTKPIRSFGADITETTLAQTLLNNNIDLMIRNLSYAEKRLLIVTTILQQTNEAQNDWARTIESVANQERILEEQIQRLNRALGNVMLPLMKTILPYLNAILMVLVEIINWIAVLVGFNEEDFDFFGEADESINDLIDSMGVAETSVKKLKQGLRNFDKLNAIKTPTSTTSTGSGLGMSPEILNLFNKTADDYLSKLTDVEMKATRIRDKIMTWLGFTKQIDETTGKVSFKFDHITSGTVLGALAVGGVIYKGVKTVMSFLQRIGLIKLTSWTVFVKNIGSLLPKLKIFGSGLGLILSITSAYDSMVSLVEETKSADEAYKQLTSSILGSVASGALLGSTFGTTGLIIGAVGGAILSITGALSGYIEKSREIEVMTSVFDGQGVAIETLGQKYRDMFASSDVWTEELTNLKSQYEETSQNVKLARDELNLFIRELNNQDEAISETQLQELNKKFDNLKTSTDEATTASIEYEKALIQAYSNTSAESTESTANQIANIEALRLKQKGYEDEYIEALRNITIERYTSGKSQAWYNEEVRKLDVAYGKIPDTLTGVNGAIDIFNDKISNIDYNNQETLNNEISKTSEAYNKAVDTLKTRKSDMESYYDSEIKKQQQIIDNFDKTALLRELTPEEKEQYETALSLISSFEQEKTNAINTINSTISEIQGSYKGFLVTVYADLVKNGADTQSAFKGTIDTIKSDLDDLKNVDMSGFGEEMFNSIMNDIETTPQKKKTLDKLASIFKSYGVETSEAFANAYINDQANGRWRSSLYNSSKETGKYTNRGYLEGIKESLSEKNGNGGEILADEVTTGAKDELGVHSPSSVFEEIGVNTVLGYINGIEDTQRDLLDSINTMLLKVQDRFNSISFGINISTSVENSFNSILYKLEVFTNKFRTGINNLLSNMTTAMNNVSVGSDNKLYYNSMPYVYVPRFKQGLDYVPNDYYLAYLDEGERVLTKQENKEYSSGKKLNNSQNNRPQIIEIYLDSEHKLATYSLEQLQALAKDNGEPIRIGD